MASRLLYIVFTLLGVCLAGCGSAQYASENVISEEDIYDIERVDSQPELIGGMESLMLGMRYPGEARRAGIQGTVMVELVVDNNGMPQDVRIIRRLSHGLDEEAIRIANRARFYPAIKDGEPVPVKQELPFHFRLGSR